MLRFLLQCASKWNSDLFHKQSDASLTFNGDAFWNVGFYCAADLLQSNYAPPLRDVKRCLKQVDRTISFDRGKTKSGCFTAL